MSRFWEIKSVFHRRKATVLIIRARVENLQILNQHLATTISQRDPIIPLNIYVHANNHLQVIVFWGTIKAIFFPLTTFPLELNVTYALTHLFRYFSSISSSSCFASTWGNSKSFQFLPSKILQTLTENRFEQVNHNHWFCVTSRNISMKKEKVRCLLLLALYYHCWC